MGLRCFEGLKLRVKEQLWKSLALSENLLKIGKKEKVKQKMYLSDNKTRQHFSFLSFCPIQNRQMISLEEVKKELCGRN